MQLGKIVAIGGGENGGLGTVYETGIFDKEIVRLSEKAKPNFLFIGFASGENAVSYYDVMKNIYGGMFGCMTDHLTAQDIKDHSLAQSKVNRADIIYVGGGNTLKLMKLLSKYNIDRLLHRAYTDEKVLCGVSAGANCWCRFGNAASLKDVTESNQYKRVAGLGLVDVLLCPHYKRNFLRQESLREMMIITRKYPAVALDFAALEIVGNQYRILTLENNAVSQKTYWKKGKYYVENLASNEYKKLDDLYKKQAL